MRLSDTGVFKISAPIRISDKAINDFIASNEQWMNNALQKQSLKTERLNIHSKVELEIETKKLFEYWQEQIGVKADRIRFRQMKTRWGVCNTISRVITINYELTKFPFVCLEYVVVHELVHLIHKNHNSTFWSKVGEYLPNYKELRKMLRN